MPTPYLTIDLDKIEHNARSVAALCRQHAIEVTGVTKGACGHPAVAKAMLRGGVASIADSRLRNLKRLRDAGVAANMLRSLCVGHVTPALAVRAEALGLVLCDQFFKTCFLRVGEDLGDLRVNLLAQGRALFL